MPRPDLSRAPQHFHGYINHVAEDDLMTALRNQTPAFIEFMNDLPAEKRGYRYAENKWTIQEMFQHIIDAERVFVYRALCFARKETTSLPSFDENEYAANSKAGNRNWNEMVEEFRALRHSTELMFGSFDHQQLEATGKANNNAIYVLALGFVTVGHINHHLRIIRERYL